MEREVELIEILKEIERLTVEDGDMHDNSGMPTREETTTANAESQFAIDDELILNFANSPLSRERLLITSVGCFFPLHLERAFRPKQ